MEHVYLKAGNLEFSMYCTDQGDRYLNGDNLKISTLLIQNSSCRKIGKNCILLVHSHKYEEKLKFFYSDCNGCADSVVSPAGGIPFRYPKAVNDVPFNEQKEVDTGD